MADITVSIAEVKRTSLFMGIFLGVLFMSIDGIGILRAVASTGVNAVLGG